MSKLSPRDVPLRNFLRYWRDALADEDIVGLADAGEAERLPTDEVGAGRLPPDVTARLTNAAAKLRNNKPVSSTRAAAGPAGSDSPDGVPVVILSKGLMANHEHGVTWRGREARPLFPLVMPAMLLDDGVLQPIPSNLPWIGREYLGPNELSDERPVLGDVAAFDDYMSSRPADGLDWPSFVTWTENLWRHVTGDEVPKGYRGIDEVRVVVYEGARNAARYIIELYDALLDNTDHPALLRNIVHGGKPPDVVRLDDRLHEAMGLPRGTMGNQYGLAASQGDAVAVHVGLKDGDILAVNGPPGTGKTTLLQSIIATEVVCRALAGGEPAIIVGCSTNNQAVTNITSSMNAVVKEDRGRDCFPWARRWVPEAETYGLYLPSGKKAESARAAGTAIAVKEGHNWSGFPEREADVGYVATAAEEWINGFEAAYGFVPRSIEAGIEHLRLDMNAIVGDLKKIAGRAQRLVGQEEWWRTTAGGAAPEEHIRASAAAATERLAAAEAEVSRCRAVLNAAQQDGDRHVNRAREAVTKAMEKVMADEAAMQDIRARCAAVMDALAPNGLVEAIFKSATARKRVARALALLTNAYTGRLFATVSASPSPNDWLAHADMLLERALADFQATSGAAASYKQSLKLVEQQSRAACIEPEARLRAARNVLEQMRNRESTALSDLNRRLQALQSARQDIAETIAGICNEEDRLPPSGNSGLQTLDDLLDVMARYELFQKAMRYWEGRWIIEARRVQAGEIKTNQGREATIARFRRWCMLTPILISTLHSIPKHMRCIGRKVGSVWPMDFLFETIDLLIMDEAGQVGPHIGAAAFALARRAVVVGDIYQIEPVSTLATGTDMANASSRGLARFWDEDGEPLAPHLISEPRGGTPQGSIMRLAQAATAATSPAMDSEPGIFLSEHRRCRGGIVAYCNDLVYKGRLKPLTAEPKKAPPLPQMAWAHVRGTCDKKGGSNRNVREAASIAQWVAGNADAWLAYYREVTGGKTDSIEDVVAVVTPFRAQASAIRDQLTTIDQAFSRITVGTVHSLQGAERPIVVFSPTYDASAARPFFDRKPNMMNVAASRAKDSFIVIGNMHLFRRGGQTPSALLGRHLFRDPDHEIPDVDGNHIIPHGALARAERISTLDRHRAVLTGALKDIKAGSRVVVASPFIAQTALYADDIFNLCKTAAGAGAHIHLVIDSELAFQKDARKTQEALALLEACGAHVHQVSGMHNKTLITGNGEIIEGSFNWLSSQRDSGSIYQRHETSWRIVGEDAAQAIPKALEEFETMGVVWRSPTRDPVSV